MAPKVQNLGWLFPLSIPIPYLSTSCLGKVWQGIPKGMRKVWPEGHRAGDPIGKPITWICCLSTRHGGIAVATWMCSSFPSSLIQEWGHCVGPGAAHCRGVTPFPPALLQPGLRMELLNSQQPTGFRLGGLQPRHFGDRGKSWLLTLRCALFSGSSPGDLCAHNPV